MLPGRRLRVAVAVLVVGLAGVGVAAVFGDSIAASIRDALRLLTPARSVLLLAVVAVAAPARRRSALPSPSRRPVWESDWPVPVALLAALAGVGWYSLGRALAVPHIFGDELTHTAAAKALAQTGTLATQGYGTVGPVLDSLGYLLTANGVAAHGMVQALNVTVMVAAAFLAYPLARRSLPPRWALAVAALAVTSPWLTYARFVLTEPAFYPVFLLFALALVRALEQPTARRQGWMLAALGLAYLTRPQALVLAPAIVVAVVLFGLARGHLRSTLQAFVPLWIVFLAGAVVLLAALAAGLWSPLGHYRALFGAQWRHPHGLAIWAASNLTSLVLGLGVLVGVAAPLGAIAMLRRAASIGASALAAVAVATTAALLATVTLLSESPYGQGSVHERDLFFAAPLIVACAVTWATGGCPRPRAATSAVAVAIVACAATIPAGAITPHTVDALSFKVWARIGHGLTPSHWIVLATALGALLTLKVRSAWPIVLTVFVAGVAVASAADYRSPETRAQAGRYDWVDAAVPASAKVLVLYVGYQEARCRVPSPLAAMSLYTEYFNLRVDEVGHLLADNRLRGVATEQLSLRPDGVVTRAGHPLRAEYVVADARLSVLGTPLVSLGAGAVEPEPASGPGALTLWRARIPLRLRRPAEVLHPSCPG